MAGNMFKFDIPDTNGKHKELLEEMSQTSKEEQFLYFPKSLGGD